MNENQSKLRELHIPPEVWDDPHARELLRAWAAKRALHVSFSDGWQEPWKWGVFLADMARHAARALAAEKHCGEAEALVEIRNRFEQELAKPTDVGTTNKLTRQ